jgi:hypothetical protein
MKLPGYHGGRLVRLALSIAESKFVMLSHRHSTDSQHATLPCQICLEMPVADHPFASQRSRG